MFGSADLCAAVFNHVPIPLMAKTALGCADALLSHVEGGAIASTPVSKNLRREGGAMITKFDEGDLQALRNRFRERHVDASDANTPQPRAAAQPAVQLNVRIPGALKATLAQYAEHHGVSLGTVIARAMVALVAADQEDLQ
jgi:predicted HicB family RNase H-like nuclease